MGLVALLLCAVTPLSLDGASRIGARADIINTELDFHSSSGHYFSVLRYDTLTEDCFSVNLSIDEGASWTEAFEYCTGQEFAEPIGAVVAGDFLYVGYVAETAVHSAKLMRFRTSDAAQDPVFGAQTIFSATVGATIPNIDLCSNADSFDNRLYYFALNEGVLRFFWTDENGGADVESWHEVATGVTDAWSTLEVTANENYAAGSGYHPMALYLSSGWSLKLWRYHGDGPVTSEIDSAAYGESENSPVSISAHDDYVAITFWNQWYEIRTCVSNDGGGSFACDVYQGDGYGFTGAVNARQGAGIANMVVFDGDPPCYFSYRQYDGPWSNQIECTDVDMSEVGFISLESLPPHTEFSYGAVILSHSPETNSAYFIRSPVVFTDGFESGDLLAW